MERLVQLKNPSLPNKRFFASLRMTSKWKEILRRSPHPLCHSEGASFPMERLLQLKNPSLPTIEILRFAQKDNFKIDKHR